MNGLSDISAPLIRPRFFSTLLRCGNGQQSRSRAVATQAEIGTSYFFYLNPLAVFYHLVISYLVSPSKHLAKANGDKGCFWGDLCVLGTGLQRWEGLLGQFGTQRDPRL